MSHRGGAKLAPENTLAAFRQAVERHRTQMLELDVQLTSDGEIVVAHDDTVDRCTEGTGRIAALTYAELSRLDAGFRFTPDGKGFPFRGKGVRIPTLREVLRAFQEMRLNIEVKPGSGGLEQAFAELIRAEKAVNRVCVGSEDDGLAAKVCAALPEACHFYPREALTAFVLAVKGGEPPPMDERYTVLDMPVEYQGVRVFDAQLRDAAANAGRWINVWTIDDEAEMGRLVAEGAGGIMTDRPDVLREVLGR
ncbi:MAG: glycerophosphodiester phosphodiesterase [Myxococcaceae bacterium]